ncbi:serine hydrolase domain-containing protein [Rhodopirellula sp. MGV]|uniref:serine hydrolase domain-containing protein n=1 Tax=Rhodopirellula sp. MGV TaxID=2023130 RepID=UPI000B975FED|nr:serine hydrolase domain-containing protein [Rhodopirellula sp. MGV]OYP38525.1 hypothetical protein CGZ80_01915 [Rhodopirellula sp. MGV]PNY34830.1 hypothetical protein C2E31_21530 [Rhodopirellula baltica]
MSNARSFAASAFLCTLLFVVAIQAADGQDAASFDSVQAFVREAVESGEVAGGNLLVFHDGEVVIETAFGYADIATKRPFEIDTPVIIASVSKPIMGTLFYRLADEGKLELERPIESYLPEFANRVLQSGEAALRSPTMTELITHTSGYQHDESPNGRIWYQPWATNQTMEYVVGRIATDYPPIRQPGEAFAYSGLGTEVAARVGEVTSGLPRNEMLQTYLCEPLGMSHTAYRDQAAMERFDVTMPTRYYRGSKSGKLWVSKVRPVAETNHYSSSGGSIISTSHDLLKWLRMILEGGQFEGEQYLTTNMHQRFLTEHEIGYAAKGGLLIRGHDDLGKPTRLSHTGSSGTNVWIDFETNTIGIMLTQTRGSDIRPFRKSLEEKVNDVVANLQLAEQN